MKGKASDICPKCKHCEGLDRFVNMYSCKHYNKYPDSAIGMDSEIDCCNFEEVNMNKVEGKVSDWCLKFKNCKSITQEHNGKTASIRLTRVECEDPYDGMAKTLNADSDICCSMFEPKSDNFCGKCERFDGTYCHDPEGTISISYKALFGEPVSCPSYEEKKEKKPCDKISCLQHELEMDKLRRKIHQLEKEKAAHMKGIERLKKSQKKLQNIVTEKEVEIKGLRKDNTRLSLDISWGNMIAEKNTELNQTISDQEITIKALLITIKEMCKDE